MVTYYSKIPQPQEAGKGHSSSSTQLREQTRELPPLEMCTQLHPMQESFYCALLLLIYILSIDAMNRMALHGTIDTTTYKDKNKYVHRQTINID